MLASGALTFGALAALGLGACGGGGGGDADVGATLTTAALVEPTEPTTIAPPSTQPTTTTPARPTTTAPIPADEPELTDALRAEITAAYDAAIAAFLDAVYDPVEPDLPTIATTRVPATAASLSEWLSDLTRRGWSARPSAENLEDRHVLAVELVSPTESRLDVCAISDAVIFETASGDIVNDLVVTTRDAVTMRLDGDAWLLQSSETLQTFEGIGSCSVFG